MTASPATHPSWPADRGAPSRADPDAPDEVRTQSAPCSLQVLRLHEVGYADAYDLQRRILEERVAGKRPDTLILLSHPPVITVGRGAADGHVLLSADELPGVESRCARPIAEVTSPFTARVRSSAT